MYLEEIGCECVDCEHGEEPMCPIRQGILDQLTAAVGFSRRTLVHGVH
jgi:putative ribosome biogenesis GTPase RsgA